MRARLAKAIDIVIHRGFLKMGCLWISGEARVTRGIPPLNQMSSCWQFGAAWINPAPRRPT